MTQIDLLNDEISELVKERNETEARMQSATSTPEYNALQTKLAALNAGISAKQSQLAEQEKIEEKVNVDVPFTISGVDLGPIPPQLIEIIDAIVKADRRLRLAEHAIELEQVEAEAKAQVDRLRESTDAEIYAIKEKVDTVSTDYEAAKATLKLIAEERDELTQTNAGLRDKVFELNMINTDLTSKLSNAAAQIEEKDKEIARLNDQIDDYQKAKVFGERQAQSIIDVSPNEAEEINGKIKKLFTSVEDWGSVLKAYKPDGNFELVKRDEFNSEWVPEVPAYQGGSESTGSFPGEAVEADVADGGISYPAPPSLDFPKQEEDAASGLDGNTAKEEVVGETVKREEFDSYMKIINNSLAALARRTGGLITEEEMRGDAA